MSIRYSITIILACLTVAACAPFQAYDGPPQSDSATALIATQSRAYRSYNAAGERIGRPLLVRLDDRDIGNSSEVRFLPGERCITLRVSSGEIRTDSTLCFDAAAGKVYEAGFLIRPIPEGDRGGRTPSRSSRELEQVWLMDVETGEIVAQEDFQVS